MEALDRLSVIAKICSELRCSSNCEHVPEYRILAKVFEIDILKRRGKVYEPVVKKKNAYSPRKSNAKGLANNKCFLELKDAGMSDKEIAKAMSLNIRTVQSIKKRVGWKPLEQSTLNEETSS
jgi:hypothetical protein